MENKTQKKLLPPYLMLTLIALIAAIVLAVTNSITEGPIEERRMAQLMEAFGDIMPAENYEEITVPGGYEVDSLYAAKNGDEIIGYCVTASKTGYQSPVAVTMGVGADGVVTAAVIGDGNFAETEGLGTRVRNESYQAQFEGLVVAEGGAIECLSGATVTSTAVLNASNAALKCVNEVALGNAPAEGDLLVFGAPEKKDTAAAPAVTGNTAAAQGFQSEVKVTATFDANGAVESIQIDSANETPGFGTRCAEDEAFLNQFIGKTAPFTAGENVDVLTGATVTSNAVIDALNQLASAPASAGAAVSASAQGFQSEVTVTLTVEGGKIASIVIDSSNETPGFGTRCAEDEAFLNQFIGQSAPVSVDVLTGATVTSKAVIAAADEALASAPASAGVTVSASKQGFQSEVTVTLTVEGGKIASIAIDSANETPGFGTRCAEDEAFLSQFIGQSAPVSADVLTGATVTSKAVIAAADEALASVPAEGEVPATVIAEGENATLAVDANGAAIVTPNAGYTGEINVNVTVDNGAVTEGEFVVPAAEEVPAVEGEEKSAFAEGFQSDVNVTVTVDAEGKIVAIKVDSSNETPGFGTRCAEDEAFLNQFVGQTIPVTVDALSGATVTSKAIVEAVNSLAPAAEEVPAAPAVEGEEKSAFAEGFQSDVNVTVTVDAEGKIVAIKVDSSNETPGFGTRCAEDEAFLNQFVGQTIPVTVDALSGATVTSKAIVEAVNSLAPAAEEVPAVEGEEKTAAAKGFQSDVNVTVTVDAEGKIVAIKVDSSNETNGFGTRCAEDEAFLNQFIGQTIPVTVDALSGATVTSNAIVTAVNSLAPAAEEVPAAPAVEGEEKTAFAKGFQSDVNVTVTVDAEGKIVAIKVDSSKETNGFGTRCAEDEAFLNQFIGQTIPVTVDALSGATVTSKAIVEAVNSLAPAAEEVPAVEGEEKTASAKGFQSDVNVTVTVDAEGKIVAIKVDSSNETPGFGTRCAEDEAFLNQFIGQTIPVTVDALSGATVTSKAIVEAVNSLAPAAEEVPAAPAVEGEEKTASAKGFQSDVNVTVTVDAEGKIVAIKVDSSNETNGFGTRCAEDEAFLNQFVGQTIPVTVDALSGATVTSNAIVEAVNSLAPAAEEVPAVEGEEKTASAKGFQSDVNVTVTVDAEGKIVAIKVDSSNETNGFGTRCAEDEAFLNQFIGQTIPVTVDALSGATVTSNAIVTAVNSLAPVAEEAPVEETPAEEVPAEEIDDGSLTASAQGIRSEVTVKVWLDAEGKITDLVIDSSNETPGFGTRCAESELFISRFIGQPLPVEVDVLGGATVTSNAVIEAVNSLAE